MVKNVIFIGRRGGIETQKFIGPIRMGHSDRGVRHTERWSENVAKPVFLDSKQIYLCQKDFEMH